MIAAILPVAIRPLIANQGVMIDGRYITSCFHQIPTPHEQEIVLGRSIPVPNLVFYKVFSMYGNLLIEHTFATDTAINLHNLNISRNINTGAVHHAAPVLVPISVKQYHDETTTYLFVNNINWLLNTLYDFGHSIKGSFYPLLDYEQSPNYPNIVSMGKYVTELLKAHNLDAIVEDPYWKPPEVEYELRDRLTPELPTGIVASIEDYITYECNTDSLWQHLNDIAAVDNPHAPLMSYIEPYLFAHPNIFDPITKLCISTPSYITADQIKPYINNTDKIEHIKRMSFYETMALENSACASFLEKCKKFDKYMFLGTDLIEFFSISKYTDITLRITRNGTSTLCNYNRFVDIGDIGVFNNNKAKTAILTNNMSIWLHGSSDDEIVVSKTWLDELFVNRIRNNQIVETLYLNINLYHLVSPSLINRDRVDYITQMKNTYI